MEHMNMEQMPEGMDYTMPEFTAAVVDGYRDAVEKLQARAAAVTDKPRMADQMAEAENRLRSITPVSPRKQRAARPKKRKYRRAAHGT